MSELLARVDLSALVPTYKSKLEEEFANHVGLILLEDACQCEVALMLYEPCTWHLAGGKYTPDFCAFLQDGRVAFVEIKGGRGASPSLRSKAARAQKGYRDTRSKLRAAAETYPMFLWFEVRMGGGDCDIERIGP